MYNVGLQNSTEKDYGRNIQYFFKTLVKTVEQLEALVKGNC